jgi:hypothetical protein
LNVAMKVPRAQFGRVLAFYRDTLALTVGEETCPEVLAVVSRSVHVYLSPITRTLWLRITQARSAEPPRATNACPVAAAEAYHPTRGADAALA